MDVPIAKNRDVKPEEYAELRRALTLISGKWKLEILWLLYHRPHRFGELLRTINGVTQHMLTRQLRELEADGLVTRTVFAEVPPRVEYGMTDATIALEPAIWALMEWSREFGTPARIAAEAKAARD
ncbi:DNA-binding HxlR family transcriptional regulator [Sphingobium fontiphilum]|uniref:DNA-binding HxlR family transcriptional regulator n=1 Tax=Sphingobium fontiphilum TaxID=944425 RepID=A0A7W6DLW4_9SPHN|nr:helix-turn-helix domain-containing protein [Sphingobium fontiphilum]MBB3982258.1 DNA-binding HxlR family transcriptional regulator [Sphingobium fontiphilum]